MGFILFIVSSWHCDFKIHLCCPTSIKDYAVARPNVSALFCSSVYVGVDTRGPQPPQVAWCPASSWVWAEFLCNGLPPAALPFSTVTWCQCQQASSDGPPLSPTASGFSPSSASDHFWKARGSLFRYNHVNVPIALWHLLPLQNYGGCSETHCPYLYNEGIQLDHLEDQRSRKSRKALGSTPSSATYQLCTLGQVASPLWASASPFVKWVSNSTYLIGCCKR